MKKLILKLGIIASLFLIQPINAQVSININLGVQPYWGPEGHDHVDYYYLPDLEMYYYVPTKQYIYLEKDRWIYVNTLPSKCSNYNLQTGYKVVLNEHKPYLHHDTYKLKYGKYKNHHGKQKNIGHGKKGGGKHHDDHHDKNKHHDKKGGHGKHK